MIGTSFLYRKMFREKVSYSASGSLRALIYFLQILVADL